MFKERGKALKDIMSMMDEEKAKKIKVIVEGDTPKEVAKGLEMAQAKMEMKGGPAGDMMEEGKMSEDVKPLKKGKIFDPMKNIEDREPLEEESEDDAMEAMADAPESEGEECCSIDSIMAKLSPEEQKLLKLKMKV